MYVVYSLIYFLSLEFSAVMLMEILIVLPHKHKFDSVLFVVLFPPEV